MFDYIIIVLVFTALIALIMFLQGEEFKNAIKDAVIFVLGVNICLIIVALVIILVPKVMIFIGITGFWWSFIPSAIIICALVYCFLNYYSKYV